MEYLILEIPNLYLEKTKLLIFSEIKIFEF